jgi:membrane peptidoglycan carboxypeptidase
VSTDDDGPRRTGGVGPRRPGAVRMGAPGGPGSGVPGSGVPGEQGGDVPAGTAAVRPDIAARPAFAGPPAQPPPAQPPTRQPPTRRPPTRQPPTRPPGEESGAPGPATSPPLSGDGGPQVPPGAGPGAPRPGGGGRTAPAAGPAARHSGATSTVPATGAAGAPGAAVAGGADGAGSAGGAGTAGAAAGAGAAALVRPHAGAPTAAGRQAPRRRLGRTRLFAVLTCALLLVLAVAAGVLYAAAKIPLPGQIRTDQVSFVTFADGTEMARIGAENRTDVPLSKVPKDVQNAVLAAEDRGYWKEPGVSVRGMARALYNDLRGASTQGGSTITQQYVKNAYLTQERTFTRKFREAVIAVKLDREYSKQQILEWYLNTIYYGRGAYGIESAAQTYFGKPVERLSVAEGAVLASSIRSPALYDPQGHPDRARARWNFVLDGMAKEGWLDPAAAATLAYPAVAPRRDSALNQISGPNGFVLGQVKNELANLGFDESLLNREGLRVQTTVDRAGQAAAVAAVRRTFAGQPANLRQALVAVDPRSGAVVAYYGGTSGTGFDYAQTWRPPGSSFKPYVLATALDLTAHHQGDTTVRSTFDGSSPRTLGGTVVHNSEGAQCPHCSLLEATKRSINTVFYDLALQVGPQRVAATAQRMGIPATHDGRPTLQQNGVTAGGIGIGQYEVRPIDQAVGFATLAAGGVARQPYFVQKITDPAGRVLYQHSDGGRRVLDGKVSNDVTYAMEPVAEYSGLPLAGGRPCASKTGTQQFGDTDYNSDAWMVGFTPQVSAAVWVGSDRPGPLKNAAGRPLYGRGLPGQTWQAFMNAYLAHQGAARLATGPQVSPAPSATPAAPLTSSPAPPPTSAPPRTTPAPSPASTAPPSTTRAPSSAPPPSPTPSAGSGCPGHNCPSPSPTASATGP